jgi:hypothetical protein
VLGLRTPARYEVETGEEFTAPLPDVYEAVANIPKYPSWRTGVLKVELIGVVETPKGERFSFREITKASGPRGVTYVVDDDTPPSKGPKGMGRRVHRIADKRPSIGGQWIFGFEPRGKNTYLLIIDQGEIRNPMLRGVAKLFMPPTKAMNQFLMDMRLYLQQHGSSVVN